ncbi:alpha,alpha-trehalose-phosphate synthase (UDP-forming) [Massilia oculi]|uniref:alpha,alpha-trehalose-phosphate synthase (UDP-forming) n=1 Tax=Massilia oculi TaxID=945844 RepID=UPI001AAE438E|nr:trehalose-6-phosphate synthase [Massilia oculi]
MTARYQTHPTTRVRGNPAHLPTHLPDGLSGERRRHERNLKTPSSLLTPADVRDSADLARLLEQLGCGDDLIVVSNRAPCIHSHTPDGIVSQRPAGGLVTALEAVLAQEGGCWIAHGSGDADRATCDERDHVRKQYLDAPYRLRRLWLDEDEVAGYYDGLSNEGLWPLCHRTDVEPTFRAADWDHYVRVNRRFAEAVVAEAATARPVVLVQDYHLALVPQMVRERLPEAVIVLFWHIPFPAPQRLARLPWREQVLRGLLASTVVGLQTPADAANFKLARAACAHGEGGAHVDAYPISIAWPGRQEPPVPGLGDDVRRRFGIAPGVRLLVGVDRMDYTKGIPERLQAFELLLEERPELLGQVTLLQIGAPCRGALPAYQEISRQVKALTERINARFGNGAWQPVVLHAASANAATVTDCYRASDVCLVTSLHDGMNLVAKEFVAARNDLRGALVLSRQAGAAAELEHALLVEPRDIAGIARAIGRALDMPPQEQMDRMRAMRGVVSQNTVFGWAARLLGDGMRVAAGRTARPDLARVGRWAVA